MRQLCPLKLYSAYLKENMCFDIDDSTGSRTSDTELQRMLYRSSPHPFMFDCFALNDLWVLSRLVGEHIFIVEFLSPISDTMNRYPNILRNW